MQVFGKIKNDIHNYSQLPVQYRFSLSRALRHPFMFQYNHLIVYQPLFRGNEISGPFYLYNHQGNYGPAENHNSLLCEECLQIFVLIIKICPCSSGFKERVLCRSYDIQCSTRYSWFRSDHLYSPKVI